MSGLPWTGWWGVVLDTPDPPALAEFYARLLGWKVTKTDPGWSTVHPGEGTAYIGCHYSESYVPPVWPPEDGKQQQMLHLDLGVSDLDSAVAYAVEAGATVAGFQPQDEVRVMLDPVGHPFCLYLDRS